MYFGGVLSLFFTNPSFGTSIHITNIIDTKSGGSNIHMLSSQNEEHKSCPFDNTFFGDDVSDGLKSENANEDFKTTIEKVLVGSKDDEEIDVSGEIEHFKENKILFRQNKFLYGSKEEEKRLDGTIARFCGMYSNGDLKGSRFIGLEEEGVFVGRGNIKGEKHFLGRREGTKMLGFLRDGQQGTDQLIGYFNMNDKGEVKNAGIIFSRSAEKVGFSIKTGPEKKDLVLFYIPLTNEINEVYEEIRKITKFNSLGNLDSVKMQVSSMFEDGQRDFDQKEVTDFCKLCNLPCNKSIASKFCSITKSDIFKKIIHDSTGKCTVCDEAFSFPIYLNGEKGNGLLFFVAEGNGSFNLCFGLQDFVDSRCVFVPLLITSFFKGDEVVGQSCFLFDYKDSSNFCRLNYSELDSSFRCNFSLPKGKEIIIGENFGEDKVYIVSPLEGNKIKHGKEQGHSLRGLIRSSESRFKSSEENNADFSLILSSSSPKTLCLEIPCLKKEAVFYFVFFPFGYSFSLSDHIKKGDKEIDTLNNFLIVWKNFVLLINDCANKDMLNVKTLKDGKLEMAANFYYPQKVRDVDSIFNFIKKIINGAVSVDGSELPFIVSLEVFKERDWNQNVDSETDAFLLDAFSNSNVETDSIKEEEKEPNTDNNINKEENINKEKKEKAIDEVVSIQKKGNNKIEYKTKLNRNKHERKKRKREEKKLDSTESSKTSNKISNDFKQGEEVTIEYFLEGKDGKKEKGEIKYKIEDEEKKFFGEKRRIVILSKEKKVPHNFTYKGSVSEILKSGEKNYPKIHELLTRALFNLSCAKILKDSSIKLSKIKNVKIRNREVFEVYIAHNTETEIGNQVRLLVAYDKAKKTFYALDSLCHYDK